MSKEENKKQPTDKFSIFNTTPPSVQYALLEDDAQVLQSTPIVNSFASIGLFYATWIKNLFSIDDPETCKDWRSIHAPFANQFGGSGKTKLALILTNSNYHSQHSIEIIPIIWEQFKTQIQNFQAAILCTKQRMQDGKSLFLKFFTYEEIKDVDDRQFVEKIFGKMISFLPEPAEDDFQKYCLGLDTHKIFASLESAKTNPNSNPFKITFWHIDEVVQQFEQDFRKIWKDLVSLFKEFRNSNVLHLFYFSGNFPFGALGCGGGTAVFGEQSPSLTQWIPLEPFKINDLTLLIQKTFDTSEKLKVEINSPIVMTKEKQTTPQETIKESISHLELELFAGVPRFSVLFVNYIKYHFQLLKERCPESPIFSSLEDFQIFKNIIIQKIELFKNSFQKANQIGSSPGLLSAMIYTSIFGELPEYLQVFDPVGKKFVQTQLGDVSAKSFLYLEKQDDKEKYKLAQGIVLEELYNEELAKIGFSLSEQFFPKSSTAFDPSKCLLNILSQGNTLETLIYVYLWENIVKVSTFIDTEFKFSEVFPFLSETDISNETIPKNFIPILFPQVNKSTKDSNIPWDDLNLSKIQSEMKKITSINPNEARELMEKLQEISDDKKIGFLIYPKSRQSTSGDLMILFKDFFIDIQTKNEIDYNFDKKEIQDDINKSIHPQTTNAKVYLIYFVTQYASNCRNLLKNQNIPLHQGHVYHCGDPQKGGPFFAQKPFDYYSQEGKKQANQFTKKEKKEIFSEKNKKFEIPEGMTVIFLSPNSFNCLKKVKIGNLTHNANEGLLKMKENKLSEVTNETDLCDQAFLDLSREIISKYHENQLILKQKQEGFLESEKKRRRIEN